MEEVPDGGTHARKLSDGAGVPSLKLRINAFFLDEAYGSFFLNMIADVVVRCMCAFVLPLLGCCLAFGCCRKGKKRKDEFSKRQLEQLSDMWEERGKAAWLTDIQQVLETDHRRSSAAPERTSTSGHGLAKHGPAEDGDGSIIIPGADGASAASHKLNGCVDQVETQRPVQKPDVRKRLNGFIKHLETDSEGRFVKSGSGISERRISGEAGAASSSDGGSSTAKFEHVLDIPVLAVLPSTASLESGDELKGIFKVKLAIKFILEMFSSRILQANVKPTEENLRALRDLAKEGMKIDREFTLQIDRFFMFYCEDNPEEPVLLNLRDFEVPTILQAEYAAGVLTIKGHHLEGAEIRIATSDEYLILQPEKQEKGSIRRLNRHEIEEWRCTDLLLPVKHDKVQIFASKRECIQKKYVTLRSEASPLVDNTLNTVMREWIPTTILFMVTFLHLVSFMTSIMNFTLILEYPNLWLSYLAPALVIYILQVLPHGVDITIKHWMNKLKLIFYTFKFTPLVEPIFIKRFKENCTSRDSIVSSNQGTSIPGAKCLNEENKSSTKPQEARKYSPANLDWNWLTYKQRYSKSKREWITVEVDPSNIDQEASQPFEVLYRMKSFNQEYYSSELDDYSSNVIVKIYSKGLQMVLQKLIARHLHTFENYAEIQAKYILQLYLQGALDKIMDLNAAGTASYYTSSIHGINPQTMVLHVFHLIRFIEKDFENIILQHQQMIAEGIISWKMLWTLFQENEKVIYYCDLSKEELCGKILSSQYKKDDSYVDRKRPAFEIELEVWDYDCVSYEPKIIKRKISEFFTERKISNLNVHPVKFQKDVAAKEAFFFNRGKMYHELVLKTERRYMQYTGSMFWSFNGSYSPGNKYQLYDSQRESMDGRVMIDQASYAKMKTKRNMGTARPANGWLQGNLETWKNLPSENDPNLQFAPTVVYGFSFSLRKWGCFLIPQLQEITFSPVAFDTLVMKEERTKRMLLAMTQHYIKRPKTVSSTSPSSEKVGTVDPLPNKGKGSIILLHGPPGTGKTLTVESLAEKMECPLWQLSVSTLKMKPKKLETRLMKKFEVATLWGAIMLLDEADVYLSSRKYSPLAPDASQGNALTGVFLRILEYYKGILFLTTNQIDHFEQAIYSRISLFLRYEEFNVDQRRQLWSHFMKRVGIQTATSAFWKEVLPRKLNGRYIRNIVSNAEVLCESQGKQINEDHILDALREMPLTTEKSLFTIEEKSEERDGQESMSIGGSHSTHDHWSLTE